MSYILGVDFDNTLVNYDEVLWKTAQRMGFLNHGVGGVKKNIRDAIRCLPEGEIKWQKVQAYAYGKAMDEAILIDGVEGFFRACRRDNIPVYIVSHKTELAAQDTEKINLRTAALAWMEKKRFFDKDGLALCRDQIFFESTRQAKVERIRQLACTHFIDDLQETFMENFFPAGITKILYSSQNEGLLDESLMVMHSWKQIYDYFFNDR